MYPVSLWCSHLTYQVNLELFKKLGKRKILNYRFQPRFSRIRDQKEEKHGLLYYDKPLVEGGVPSVVVGKGLKEEECVSVKVKIGQVVFTLHVS